MLKRLFIGFQKGLSVPSLPEHIIKLQNNVFIRILRVLGGISILLLITKKLNYLGDGNLYLISLFICLLFSIIFSIYLMYINYYRIKHIYKVLKNKVINNIYPTFKLF